MSERYIITADQGHLRIYAERQDPGQFSPTLDLVESMDFPFGRASYTDRDTDMAGRFPGAKKQSAGVGGPGKVGHTGMSIDERLPMQREESRRRAREIAAEIESFLQQHPDASWDFAAGAELNHAIVDLLNPAVRQRLRRTVSKDLVNQRIDEVRAHFAGT